MIRIMSSNEIVRIVRQNAAKKRKLQQLVVAKQDVVHLQELFADDEYLSEITPSKIRSVSKKIMDLLDGGGAATSSGRRHQSQSDQGRHV